MKNLEFDYLTSYLSTELDELAKCVPVTPDAAFSRPRALEFDGARHDGR